MKDLIRACITTQVDYSDIPVQDRIYIAFGRYITNICGDYDHFNLKADIKDIKEEMLFLEDVWRNKNGEEKGES